MNKWNFYQYCCYLFVFLVALVNPAFAVTVLQEGPNYSTGLFEQKVSDIDVKVMGGNISLTRKLSDGRWYFMQNWTDINYKQIVTEKTNPDTGESYYEYKDDSEYLNRNGYWYKLDDNSEGTIYRYDNDKKIVKSEIGLRWSDRSGEWIDYAPDGKINAFGNSSGTMAKFVRNSEGLIEQVLDRNENTILTITYEGNNPATVEDYTGRKVTYAWEDHNLVKVTDVNNKDWVYSYDLFGPHASNMVYNPLLPHNPRGGTIRGYTINGSYIVFSGIIDGLGRQLKINNTFHVGHIDRLCWDGGTGSYTELVERVDPDTGQITVEEVVHGGATKQYCRQVMVPDQVLSESIKNSDDKKTYFSYAYNADTKTYVKTDVDENGVKTQTFFGIDGAIKKQTRGDQLVFSRARVGNKKLVADSDGNVTETLYDDFDNIIKITNPDKTTQTFTYHPDYNVVTRIEDEKGLITTYSYDQQGRVTQEIFAQGLAEQITTDYSYDDNGLLKSIAMPGNATTKSRLVEFEYDAFGNLSKQTANSDITLQYQDYTATGQAQTYIDGRGKIWRLQYNALGLLSKISDPLNHSYVYDYDAAGNVIKITDPESVTTRFSYDAKNRLLSTTDADGKSKKFQYSAQGILTRFEDELGKVQSLQLDRAGRIQAIIDGNGNKTQLVVGKNSETGRGSFHDIGQINYPTFSQKFQYDSRKRPTQITLIDNGNESIYQSDYDKSGLKTKTIDPNGLVEQFEYDALGNVTKNTTDSLSSYSEYNLFGELIKFSDRNGHVTSFDYDAHGRMIKKHRDGFGDWIYSYDNNDNLISEIKPNGSKLIFTYDDANRLLEEQWFASVIAGSPSNTIAYSYNKNSELMGWESNGQSSVFVRDKKGEILSETINFGGFSKTYQHSYYANGSTQSLTMPDDTVYSYQYDNNNQLTRLQIPGQGSLTTNEYNWSVPAKETLPGGVTRDYQYTGLLKLISEQVATPGDQAVLDLAYQYGDAQELVQRKNNQQTIDYQYDAVNRLQQADITEENGQKTTENYLFDANNNIISNHQQSDWVYNAAGQLIQKGEDTYFYDANGNQIKTVIAGVTRHYVYNIKDRLIRIEDAAKTEIASYVYDPMGRRISKTVSGKTTYFLYNKQGLIAEYNSSGQELSSYGYRPDNIWGTDPVFLKTGEQTAKKYYYYHNDHLGTPYRLTDNTGFVVWSAQFNSFGEATLALTNKITNNLRFPGQYYDAESGLHYNWFRYYDPSIGRYITSDPIGLAGGANTYAYVGGNPVGLMDPDGRFAHFIGGLAGFAFGLTAALLQDQSGWCAIRAGLYAGVAGVFSAGSSVFTAMVVSSTLSAVEQYNRSCEISLLEIAANGVTAGLGAKIGNVAGLWKHPKNMVEVDRSWYNPKFIFEYFKMIPKKKIDLNIDEREILSGTVGGITEHGGNTTRSSFGGKCGSDCP